MKASKTSLLAALAIGSLWAMNASAQTYYGSGDLLLGIRNGGSYDVVVDLGSYSQFTTNGGTAFTVATLGSGTLSNQLSTAGISLANLTFSVFGDTGIATVFATRMSGLPFWASQSQSAQSVPVSRIEGIGAGYNDILTSGNSTVISSTYYFGGNSSYTRGVGAGGNLNFFSSSIENSTYSGFPQIYSDLFQLNPSSGVGSDLGVFTLDSAGVLTFTPVPEPSTLALMGMGAMSLIALRRKNAKI